MRYVQFQYKNAQHVLVLGSASRSKSGAVAIWEFSSDPDQQPFKFEPGKEANMAWLAVRVAVDNP